MKSSGKIIPNVLKLIASFRKNNLPVIFTRHANKKGSGCGVMGKWWNNKLPRDGDVQSELAPKLKPADGEIVITKEKYSAFEQTGLKAILTKLNINEVILCGVMTHLCVETTARHAFLLDFQPVIISDACASDTISHHKAALLNLGHGFAHITSTKEIIKIL